jgi:chaperone modulatory protein CbpM
MIRIELVLTLVSGLQRPDLDRWIAHRFVLPEAVSGSYVFREIDIARIRLIQELRDDLQVNEEALPIVLSLLDQLYEVRRRMRKLGDALGQTAPEDVCRAVAKRLADRNDGELPPLTG